MAAETAPDGVDVTVYEGLGDLPFYNEDIDNADRAPASVVALRTAAADADAALVVTPEYNGSIPGVLKNAIDWLSRPFGNGALKDKPLAVIGASSASTAACGRTTRPASRSASRGRGSSIDQAVGAVQVAGRQAPAGERRAGGEPARHRREVGRRSGLTVLLTQSRRTGLS